MKKKMIIYMSKMSVGGMEKVLLNLLEQSNFTHNYDVTVYMLYSKEDTYLKDLEKLTTVKLLWKYRWNIIGKFVCAIRMVIDLLKIKIGKSKWDIAICYPYQHPILAKLALNSSKNSIIFIHNNLKLKYGDKIFSHCKKMKFDKFAKVVCVSKNALQAFKNIYPNYQGKAITINNYINGDEIIAKSKEKISDFIKDNNMITFINIARHEEVSKGISRIIKASARLRDDGFKFKVLLVGNGKDHQYYKDLVKEYDLEDIVILVGNKVNPYPYLRVSDCFVFSSYYEGYGIVLDEARILNKPIITTDVADAKMIVNDGYGILCDNSEDGIYYGMKKYLDNGFVLKKKFDYIKFNSKITKLLDNIVK